MSPLELVDDRFGKLAEELRASKPIASAALREQVAGLRPPEAAASRWSFRLPPKRLVVGLAGAALLASLVAAVVTRSDESAPRSAGVATVSSGSVTTVESGDAAGAGGVAQDRRTMAPKALGARTPSATAGRRQRYEATLRLRVNDVDALSAAAKRAMSVTRSLGGYVGSVQYATSRKRGSATLVLRVPVASMQDALARLTGLGTILQQQTGILDVTKRAHTETRQIAKLERELPTATTERAAVIRLKLKTLRAKHARLVRSARLARIELGLTTPAKQAAAAPSRFDRTLGDAGAVLLRELEFLLYALVVVGPLLLLGGAALATARAQRRRSDGRLLERS